MDTIAHSLSGISTNGRLQPSEQQYDGRQPGGALSDKALIEIAIFSRDSIYRNVIYRVSESRPNRWVPLESKVPASAVVCQCVGAHVRVCL